MSILSTRVGSISDDGLLAIVEALHKYVWSGALRLRHGKQFGNVWMVGGEIVHAVWNEGLDRQEGRPALERLLRWQKGTYLLEDSSLPPERSLREETRDILHGVYKEVNCCDKKSAAEVSTARVNLSSLLSDLRERVPGIESLSVSSGDALGATTEHDTKTREWLDQQWRAFRDSMGDRAETLLLRRGDRTLLVVRNGSLATILLAQPSTDPEKLLWAGAEAERKIEELNHQHIPVKDE